MGMDNSRHKTLKLVLSQEGIDGINLFFACCYKSRKAISYFNNFWVGVVENGPRYLDHGTR